MKALLAHIIIACFFMVNTEAQRICEASKKKVTLKGGNTVWVYRELGNGAVPKFYYVPTRFQLHTKKGRSSYSYQMFDTQKGADSQGAILHFLVTWGLDSAQKRELQEHIKREFGPKAVLNGAVYLSSAAPRPIMGTDTELGKLLNASLTSVGTAPTNANGQMAMSFKIKGKAVKVLKQALLEPYRFGATQLMVDYVFSTHTCTSAIKVAKKQSIRVKGNFKSMFQ